MGFALSVVPAASSIAADLEPWYGPAIAFAIDMLDGPRTDLSAFRGQVVLLHFFATWCEPCIEETAALNRLATRHAGKPFTILAVNVGEVDARVRTFAHENGVAFPILLDRDRSTMKAWKVEGLPTTFVLDTGLAPALFAKGDVAWDDPSIDKRLIEFIANAGTREKPAAVNN